MTKILNGNKLLMTLIVCLSVTNFAYSESYDTGNERDWLLNAESEKDRLILLQNYLGGFSASMWEVGYRYKSIFLALQDENFDLAIYHWEKIKTAIKNGYLKRPARKANADAIFLDLVYGNVLGSFESRDIKKAWQGFSNGRSACMKCHAAEKIPWMNNQPLFRTTVAPL
ncbi:hypothetical protein ACJJIP_18760 [Microbulbifer sp. VTAC004]|uniref:hypothetical protein n=1 Tax=Microbulbifer TaxID=48073 RepID=UPI0012FB5AD8|nr:hypothetical protein [Microbulbifer variabilis]